MQVSVNKRDGKNKSFKQNAKRVQAEYRTSAGSRTRTSSTRSDPQSSANAAPTLSKKLSSLVRRAATNTSKKNMHRLTRKTDRPPVKIHLTQPLLPWLQPRSSRVEHVRGVRSSACDMWRAAIWAMHLHCVWLDSLASGFVPMRSVALGGHPVGRSLSVAVIRGSGPKDSGVICVSVSLALCAMSMMTTALSN